MATTDDGPTRDDLVQEVVQPRATPRVPTACDAMSDEDCDRFEACQDCPAWVPPGRGARA